MPVDRVMIWRIVGGLAVLLVSFFGTLQLIDMFTSLDSVRAEHARSIKTALESYKAKRGGYPVTYMGNPLSDLKKELVDGGYLSAIPQDPGDLADKQYYYVATDVSSYGLLFHVQPRDGKDPADSKCVTGVGATGRGWWGTPPRCPF